MISQNLINQLVIDEGEVLLPYECQAGKLTIGIGHNLDDNGITRAESRYILENDLKKVYLELQTNFDWFEQLSIIRASVLINMCFNLGITRLLRFKKTLRYLKANNFEMTAKEMLDSKWAKQVGKRALRLSEQMRSNSWEIRGN